MNLFLSSQIQKHYAALLANDVLGGVGLIVFLFLLCFLIVHFFVLAGIGWEVQREAQKKKETQSESKKEEKTAPEPKKTSEREPIYYIVERKRTKTRPKTTYSEPKEIRFK